MTSQMYKLKDIRAMLNVSRNTLYSWIKQGKLKSVKIGRHHFVKEEDLQRLIEGK
jgi:excisionase family DNA binding protein